MTFGFMTIVLNGGDYLEFSLRNTYTLASMFPGSKIVLVEGADSFSNPDASTKNGYSMDGTVHIIRAFPDPLDIIKYVPLGNVQDKRTLRQTGLEALNGVDYIIIRDHDEFIKPEDFKRIAVLAESRDCINLMHYMFRGTFNLRYSGGQGGYTLRGYRNSPGIVYSNWHIFPILDGKQIGKLPMAKDTCTLIPFYHFGYVTTGLRLYNKRIFTVHQLNWYYTNIAPKPGYIPLEMPVYENYYNNPDILPVDRMISVSNEDLPIELKNHPWWGKSLEEIWNWSDAFAENLKRKSKEKGEF